MGQWASGGYNQTRLPDRQTGLVIRLLELRALCESSIH
jgi:hypothetical protein